ncbi:MAG: hypothetical protein QN161_01660 [Armatimonadota bacterium]|nr:hypothetical protein [Armatimonadota bacterium]
MRRIRWSGEAVAGLAALSRSEQERVVHRLELAAEFPRMNPVRMRALFKGLRYSVVSRRRVVYCRESADAVEVVAVVPGQRAR